MVDMHSKTPNEDVFVPEASASQRRAVADEAGRRASAAGTPDSQSASFELPDNTPLAPPPNAHLLRRPVQP